MDTTKSKPKNSAPHSILGKQAEKRVADWLTTQGYTIIAHNYRQKWGEIDLIAKHGKTIAFIEVKCRTHHYFELSQVITPAKQKKLLKTARSFLLEHPHPEMIYRFDVALVHKESPSSITYIPNAFEPSHEYI